jgi:hypothetical protein
VKHGWKIVENPPPRDKFVRSPATLALILPKVGDTMATVPGATMQSAAAYLTDLDVEAIEKVEVWRERARAVVVMVVTLDSGQELEFEIREREMLDMPRPEIAAMSVLLWEGPR